MRVAIVVWGEVSLFGSMRGMEREEGSYGFLFGVFSDVGSDIKTMKPENISYIHFYPLHCLNTFAYPQH